MHTPQSYTQINRALLREEAEWKSIEVFRMSPSNTVKIREQGIWSDIYDGG